MKTRLPLILLVGLSTLGTGCVGSGPNTQQGAFAGGAVGALAGAVIGNNSRGHNAVGGAVLGGIAGAVVGGTVGNSLDHQRGTLYTSEGPATTDYAVRVPPVPPDSPPEVMVAQPDPDTVWVGGYWIYESHGYAWVPGHWERPPPRYSAFVPPHWARHEGSYLYVRGYWR